MPSRRQRDERIAKLEAELAALRRVAEAAQIIVDKAEYRPDLNGWELVRSEWIGSLEAFLDALPKEEK